MTLKGIGQLFAWTTGGACLWVSITTYTGGDVSGVIGAVVFMLGYWRLYEKGVSQDQKELHRESFANSLYFQGFLLTIWALMMSLTVWGFGIEGVDAGGVLSRIGVALSTTFVGLSLRTYLIQFHETTDEIARALEFEIASKSERLAAELSASVGSVSRARAGLELEIEAMRESIRTATLDQQVSASKIAEVLARSFHKDVEATIELITESQIETKNQLETTIEKITNSQIETKNQLETVVSTISVSSEKLRDSAESLSAASDSVNQIGSEQRRILIEVLQKQTESLSNAMERMTIDALGRVGDVVEGLQVKIQDFRLNDEAITEAVISHFDGFDELTARINSSTLQTAEVVTQAQDAAEALGEALEGLKGVTTTISSLPNAIQTTANAMSSFEASIGRCAQNLGEIDSSLTDTAQQFDNLALTVGLAPEHINSFQDKISIASSELGEELEGARDSVNDLRKTLISGASSELNEELEGAKQSLVDFRETLVSGASSELSKELEGVKNSLADFRETLVSGASSELAEELEGAKKSLTDFRETLVSGADVLASEIENS